jgi:integrase
MRQERTARRRPRGTGCLLLRQDKAGRETWYAKIEVNGRSIKRKLGRRREAGSKIGLNRQQAERALRQLIKEMEAAPPAQERVTLAEAGERHFLHLEALGRKRSTLSDYESMLRVHLVPFFNPRSIERITALDVESYINTKTRSGVSGKSIRNQLALLNAILVYSQRHGWATTNPVRLVEKPTTSSQRDIRYLDEGELKALLGAVPDDDLGHTESVLYLTAAMTGLRRGELLALRWQDIDWPARLIRVRRSFTRGEFGTPKSRRSSRAVPMADRLAEELERHCRRSRFQESADLVFPHPTLGTVLDPSKLRYRFTLAVQRAALRPVRFHDLRHTFGTRMAAAGAPLRAIQEWMGHRSYQTTEIYADYAPDNSHGALWAQNAFPRTTLPTRARSSS